MSHRELRLNRYRRYPRVRVTTPFPCSLAPLEEVGWFRKPQEVLGVVYDVSLRGVRVSTEAVVRPGDRLALTLQLPKQVVPAEVAVATVRWTKDHLCGLAFQRLSLSAQGRLRKYMAVTNRTAV